jgi:hypothetical protein
MLVVASHGMQNESNVFIIPTQANCNDKLNLERTCVSHLTVLEYLNECLDDKARHASGIIKELIFLLIMDMCRVPGQISLTKPMSDPEQNKGPRCWSIRYSTSRGSVAADGAQGSHSPLVLGLLDKKSGIFALSVSLEQGIKNACKAVEELSGIDTRQRPTDMNLRLLGNFTLRKPERPRSLSEGAVPVNTAKAFLHEEEVQLRVSFAVPQTLDARECRGLIGLPEGLTALTALQMLGSVQECKRLTEVPGGLSALTALQTLDLTLCGGLRGLPEGLCALTALKTLDLTRCEGLRGLPEGLSALTALQTLNLYRCRGLRGLPEGL